MRIGWATDIHLNFLTEEKLALFVAQIRALTPDALVVTGDISEAGGLAEHLEALEAADVDVHFVLGNHDYYGSSIDEVRASIRTLSRARPRLSYLPDAGVVSLTKGCALVGIDGWGDARLGNPATPLMLSDFIHIRDLLGLAPDARNEKLRRIADDEASALAPILDEALSRFEHVVVATHVPPFREACWHEGEISDDNWLPFFTCKAVGDLLIDRARSHRDSTITVLCGHTHGAGEAQVDTNLRVITGAADYGDPVVRALEF